MTDRLEQRARDAVARLLVHSLTVPRVYFEAPWPDTRFRVDILAIDRDASGDVHVVEVKRQSSTDLALVDQLMAAPAHFRWLASVGGSSSDGSTKEGLEELQPKFGMGRIGLIRVVRMADDDLGANVVIRAERFRAEAIGETVGWFTKRYEADIAFGDSDIEVSQESASVPDETAISERINEVRQLATLGHSKAAFILAWAAFESAIRSIAKKRDLALERQTPVALVRLARFAGLIEAHEESQLLSAAQVRNAVVHGAEQPGATYPVEDLLQLMDLINARAALTKSR